MRKRLPIVIMLIICWSGLTVFAQSDEDREQQPVSDTLWEMSLDELLDLEVITASKKLQTLEDAPSAVYVITAADIRLFGATNLGEALRMVPGIEILQGGDQNYEITIRGISVTSYNTSDRILWLINGRSVRNEAYGGVRLEALNIAMDEIEQIEVIRGTGSALYGANAFHGIVNIITKPAAELGGLSLEGIYGSYRQATANVRYGQQLMNNLHFKATFGYENLDQAEERFHGMSESRVDSLKDIGYVEGNKSCYQINRIDASLEYTTEQTSIAVSGGYADNMADHYYLIPGEMSFEDYYAQLDVSHGANSFRFYFSGQDDGEYDQNRFLKQVQTPLGPRDVTHDGFYIRNNMYDAEFQRSHSFGDDISIVAGVSYRHNEATSRVFNLEGTEASETEDLFAVFAQAEYSPREKLNLVLGGRLDDHTLVGSHFNPRFAAIYKPKEGHALRMGVGTATKSPNLLLSYNRVVGKVQNLRTGLAPYYENMLMVDPVNNLGLSSDYVKIKIDVEELKEERITSYELGYRLNLNENILLTADVFYNQLKNPLDFDPLEVVNVVDTIENIHHLMPGTATLIPNDISQDEMPGVLNGLQEQIDWLIANGQPEQAAQLESVKMGLESLSLLYNTPKEMRFPVLSADETWNSFGGELSVVYQINKNFRLMGNYAFLKFDDDFNYRQVKSTDDTGNEVLAEVDRIRSPEHKINVGLEFQQFDNKGLYAGVLFNYMSKMTELADMNNNGYYDPYDIIDYPDSHMMEIDPRTNLNVNLGYKWAGIDVFVTGYNLIQDDYQQIFFLPGESELDNLHTRFMGGMRITF